MSKVNQDDILEEAKERYERGYDADRDERELAKEDLVFANGDQWPEENKVERKRDNRPCLTFNMLPKYIDQVIGEHLQNKPGINVVAEDMDATDEIANINEGKIRHIESKSAAKVAYAVGFKSSAACGRGFWRVNHDFIDSDSFDEELQILPIKNQFSVVWDPGAEKPDLSDAEWMFVIETLQAKDYERKYPDAEKIDFKAIKSYNGWVTTDNVRIAEYFRKVHTPKTIYQLDDGSTSYDPKYEKSKKVARKRESDEVTIEWYKITGHEILEGPIAWPGKYIPIIPVWGKELNIEEKTIHRGVIRFAKAPQQMYNYWRTASAEVVAQAPRNPYIGTEAQFKGYEDVWKAAHKSSTPYLPYNSDPQAPGPPKREKPATIPTGIVNEANSAAQEMRDTTGMPEAGLGEPSNEKSGKAIEARRSGSDRGNYEYVSSFCNALIHTGEILVDLIPKIYNTERLIRIQDIDESEELKLVNAVKDPQTDEPLPEGEFYNDLTKGKFSITITTGPSYTTQRMEAADTMMEFARAMPEHAAIIMDLIFEALDMPNADRIAKRFKMFLPPAVRQMEETGDGKEGEMVQQQQPEEPEKPDMEMQLKMEKTLTEIEGKKLDNIKKEIELTGGE